MSVRILLPTLTAWLACISVAVAQPATASAEMRTASPEDVGMSAEKLALVVPALQGFVDEEKVAGAIVMVARHGKVVLFDAIGYRDVDTKQPMKTDSILRFYSMTKPMTSVGIMMLVEEGLISLDDSLAKHLPEFQDVRVFVEQTDGELQTTDPVRAPTIRDLLRHTSGLTYGFFGNTPVDQAYLANGVLAPTHDLRTTVERASSIPLLFQPGTRFNYSIATDVLGHVIERVAGQRLDRFLQDRVFDPLDMRDTGFHVAAANAERFTSNHGPQAGGGLRVVDAANSSRYLSVPKLFSGGGGTVSTARDYMRFCQMLLNKGELNGTRLLPAESISRMTKNQLPTTAYPINMSGINRDGIGFGLGFSVCVKEGFPGIVEAEYGWGGAASTHFWISPNDDLAVVVLSQLRPFSLQLELAVKPLIYDAIVD